MLASHRKELVRHETEKKDIRKQHSSSAKVPRAELDDVNLKLKAAEAIPSPQSCLSSLQFLSTFFLLLLHL